MARVVVYKGLSSVIPIFDSTTRNNLNAFRLNIKIKEEPVDNADGTNETCDATETSCLGQSIVEDPQPTEQQEKKIISTRSRTSRWAHTAGGASTRSSTFKKNNNTDTNQVDVTSTESNVQVALSQDETEKVPELNNVRRTRGYGFSTCIECDICFTTFTDDLSLKMHKTRLSKKIMTCHVCRKDFTNPILLASHRRSNHRGINWQHFKYKCDHCKVTFIKKPSLQQHIFHYHDLNEIPRRVKRRVQSVVKTFRSFNSSNPSPKNNKSNKRKRENFINNSPTNKLIINKKRKIINTNKSVDEPLVDTISPDHIVSAEKPVTTDILTPPASIEKQSTSTQKPPLVKIFANQVDELLNEKESSSTNSYRDSSDSEESSDDDADENINKEYSLRSGIRSAELVRFMRSPSSSGMPTRSILRQWALLRRRFNCHGCKVVLKSGESVKDSNENDKNDLNRTDGEANDTVQAENRPTVGIELQNLDRALQILEGNNDNSIVNTIIQEEQHEIINSKNITTSQPPQESISPKISRPLYKSSICQTRFTTQKKLIYHYLCYHIAPARQECAICRSRFAGSAELRKHLVMHCIAIPKSDQEKSPIDLKGPCERYKKKFECNGCTKKFWLVSCLDEHKQHCSYSQRVENMNTSNNNSQDTNGQVHLQCPIKVVPLQKLMPEKISIKVENENVKETTDINEPCPDLSYKILAESNRYKEHNYSKTGLSNLVTSNDPPKNNQPQIVPTVFSCNVCRSQFKSSDALYGHIRKFQPQIDQNTGGILKIKECSICYTSFPSVPLYQAHLRATHSRELPPCQHKCLICNQRFTQRKYLREHTIHIHANELEKLTHQPVQSQIRKSMTCLKCNATFHNRRQYLEHCMYYYDDEIFECATCGEKFRGRFRAHYHTKMDHFAKNKQETYIHRCGACDEGFLYRSHLHSHIRHVHDNHISLVTIQSGHKDKNTSETQPLICNVCKQQFTNQSSYDQHQMEYSNKGKLNCALCNQKFAISTLLLNHVKISHSEICGPDQRKCDICNMHVPINSWIAHVKHYHGNTAIQSNLSNQNINSPHLETLQHADVTSTSKHIFKIEYTCALCDLKFVSPTAYKNHRKNKECTGVEYGVENHVDADENADVDVESNETDIDVVGISESSQQPSSDKIDTVDPLLPEAIPTDVPENTTETMKSNFEITNIYSVELEEYENLQNSDISDNSKTKDNTKDLTTENKVKTNNNSLTCDICDLKFQNRNAISCHRVNYSNTGNITCHYCERKFITKSCCIKHEKKHRTRATDKKKIDVEYYCEACDEKFSSTRTKIAHFAHLHGIKFNGPKGYNPLCNLNKITSQSLDEQRQTRQQARLETLVSKDVSFEKQLKHNETHEKQLNMKIVEKDEILPVAQNPVDDTNEVHQDPTPVQFESNLEDDNGESRENVQEPSALPEATSDTDNSDDDTSPVLCDLCGLVVENKKLLVTHQESHSNPEAIEVDLTVDEDNYDDDVVTIDDSDSNSYPVLKYVISNKNTSINSSQIKTATNNIVSCTLCHTAFPSINMLNHHISTIHRFQCESKEKKNLLHHRYTPASSHSCKQCGRIFTTEHYLRAHMLKSGCKDNRLKIIHGKNLSTNDNNSKIITQKLTTLGQIVTQNAIKKTQINGTMAFGSEQKITTERTMINRTTNDMGVSTNTSFIPESGVINVIRPNSSSSSSFQLYQLIALSRNTLAIPCNPPPLKNLN